MYADAVVKSSSDIFLNFCANLLRSIVPVYASEGKVFTGIIDIILKPASSIALTCFEIGSLLIKYGLLPFINYQVKSENDQ